MILMIIVLIALVLWFAGTARTVNRNIVLWPMLALLVFFALRFIFMHGPGPWLYSELGLGRLGYLAAALIINALFYTWVLIFCFAFQALAARGVVKSKA